MIKKTAGIPGLLPLYVNMQSRVAERLSKKLRIFKHSPCRVVGWDLHPADRQRDEEPERRLNYLPRCIYLKFENATWRIHPDLPVGVFPLRPVKREWVVNRTTDAKVTRKGFQLLPDFACTAHMVQGGNLEAALTDCGDVTDMPGLQEMLTAYVAFSRVKRAETLLMLRSFSPNLFSHGPPPGPHCLMKLLRARLSSGGDAHCTLDHARREYEDLTAARTTAREARKNAGTVWTCFDCCRSYPAEAYNASRTKAMDIFIRCIAPGQWLTCSACAEAHQLAKEIPAEESEEQSCSKCGDRKPTAYFAEGCEWCRSCELEERFSIRHCSSCNKCECPSASIAKGRGADRPTYTESSCFCTACKPRDHEYTCTICKTRKDEKEFPLPTLQRRRRTCILRCVACYTCTVCHKQRNDGRHFVTGTQQCWGCANMYTCDVCGSRKKKQSLTLAYCTTFAHMAASAYVGSARKTATRPKIPRHTDAGTDAKAAICFSMQRI